MIELGGLAAGEEPRKGHPKCVEVAACVGVTGELLGGHVAEGADDRGASADASAEVADTAEVDQGEGALLAQDDVRGLDVPVDERGGEVVEVLEDLQNPARDTDGEVLVDALLLQDQLEVETIDERLGHVETDVGATAEGERVYELGDPRVGELLEHVLLALKQVDGLGVRYGREDELFEGDDARRPRRLVDPAARGYLELLLDDVVVAADEGTALAALVVCQRWRTA
ncbi:MAG: hypothetical protein QM765_30765 [Myxococcales bacterium]